LFINSGRRTFLYSLPRRGDKKKITSPLAGRKKTFSSPQVKRKNTPLSLRGEAKGEGYETQEYRPMQKFAEATDGSGKEALVNSSESSNWWNKIQTPVFDREVYSRFLLSCISGWY
jgi:hypothetical protein